MDPEVTAYAVADPNGDVLITTVRHTPALAKMAAVNALHWPGRWPSMVAAGYAIIRVAVRVLPDEEDPS